ncbi:leucine-rich repeat-containing protein kinase family protein [Candidatus Uabimicrobium amorphum]|uniref:Protein kinase domain-containing protein n=1 Tax=Uabimicrobium amorphum TaxID=2596890 RepID=A0A5S9IUR2_UABAM|nr:leucine-rich repeat domain-containing protein [Candidatus Uabimicrobium amorphum]BBM88127.1 hypothetical protein UABAM_06543 [Candidatus Uabimicrobium amorphum]
MAQKYITKDNYLGIKGDLTLPPVCIITGEEVQGESVHSNIVQRFFSPLHVILISVSTVSLFLVPYALLFYVSLYVFYKLCTRNRYPQTIHYYISRRAIRTSMLWNLCAATSFAVLVAYYERIFPGILAAWLIHYMFARTEIYIVKREASYTFLHGISTRARKKILSLNISMANRPFPATASSETLGNDHNLLPPHVIENLSPPSKGNLQPIVKKQSKKTIDISGQNLKYVHQELLEGVVEKDVEEFKASNNPIGQIPPGIFAFENLRNLEMNNTRITFMTGIDKLSRLEKCYVASNRIRKIPDEIRKLSSLTTLDVSSNRLKDIPAEISFTALIELRLHNNFINKVPEQIIHLRSLTILDLSNNKINELPENIGQLKLLQKLYLQNNHLQSLPHSFAQLHQLEELNLGNNQFSEIPQELQHLPKLCHLNISQNEISDISGNNLQNLMNLDVSHNNLSQVTLCFPQLHTINFSHNNLAHVVIDVETSQKLRQIELSHNKLQQLPQEIFHIPSLEKLYLNHNQLQNIPSLENAQQLKKIELRNNDLHEFPKSFANLQHKVHIDVSQNPHIDIPAQHQHEIEYDWSKLNVFDNKQPLNPFIVKTKEHVIELTTTECIPYPDIEKYQQQTYLWQSGHLKPLTKIENTIPENTAIISENKLHFVREKRRFAIKETFAHYSLLLPCPNNDSLSKVFVAYDNRNFCRIEIFEASLSFHKDFITSLQQEIKKQRGQEATTVYTLGQHQQQIYVVTNFYKGVPLQHYIQNNQLSLGETIYWIVQVLSLVKRATIDNNYITLNNINAYHYTLNLVGLETQKARESVQKNISHQGKVQDNKYHFCSPQVLMDKSTPNTQPNLIYSQGIIFFFLLTKRLPFHHTQLLQLILLIIDKQPGDMTIYNHSLKAQPICDIIYKMIAKKPQDRHQNEQQVIADIQKHYPKLFIKHFCIHKQVNSGKYYKMYTGLDTKTAQVSSIITFHDTIQLSSIQKKCIHAYPQIQFFNDNGHNGVAIPHRHLHRITEKQQPLTVVYFALEIIDILQELNAYDLFPILHENMLGIDEKQNLRLNIPEMMQQLATKKEDSTQLVSIEKACNLNNSKEINYRLPDEILTPQYNTTAQIYSLGVTMYNMVSGSYPYTKKELLHMDSSFYHRRILLHSNETPQPLRKIINKAISYLDPTYTKWQQLRQDLHQCYNELKTKLLNSA